jgi:hypothetical protein
LLFESLGALGGVTCLKYPFMIGRGRSYRCWRNPLGPIPMLVFVR